MIATTFPGTGGTWAWELLDADGELLSSGVAATQNLARVDSAQAFFAAEQQGRGVDLAISGLAVRFGGTHGR